MDGWRGWEEKGEVAREMTGLEGAVVDRKWTNLPTSEKRKSLAFLMVLKRNTLCSSFQPPSFMYRAILLAKKKGAWTCKTLTKQAQALKCKSIFFPSNTSGVEGG
jgi:hypothetical protein